MNTNSNDQNGEYTEENKGMKENSNPTCRHVAKLYKSYSCW